MPKTLIIAEKPSVMNDLAKALTTALGKFNKVAPGATSITKTTRRSSLPPSATW